MDTPAGHVHMTFEEVYKGCIVVPEIGLTFASKHRITLCKQNDHNDDETIHTKWKMGRQR